MSHSKNMGLSLPDPPARKNFLPSYWSISIVGLACLKRKEGA
jgi:hypothetical protein